MQHQAQTVATWRPWELKYHGQVAVPTTMMVVACSTEVLVHHHLDGYKSASSDTSRAPLCAHYHRAPHPCCLIISDERATSVTPLPAGCPGHFQRAHTTMVRCPDQAYLIACLTPRGCVCTMSSDP